MRILPYSELGDPPEERLWRKSLYTRVYSGSPFVIITDYRARPGTPIDVQIMGLRAWILCGANLLNTYLRGRESGFPRCCSLRFAIWHLVHREEPPERWGLLPWAWMGFRPCDRHGDPLTLVARLEQRGVLGLTR